METMSCSKTRCSSDVGPMQSYLVKTTILIAMIHMAIGCAWHHGFGYPHACASSCGASSATVSLLCAKGNDSAATTHCASTAMDLCCDHPAITPSDTDLDRTLLGAEYVGGECTTHQQQIPHPIVCDDDRCSFTKVNCFDCGVFCEFREYLGGSLRLNADSDLGSPAVAVSSFPCCHRTAPGLRAHLVLGIQLL